MNRPRPAEYQIPEDVLTAHLADEAVLLHMGTHAYHQLNGTAAFVWKGLERGLDRAALLDEICRAYEVDRDVAESQIHALLRRLEERQLLLRAPEPTADPR